MCPVRTLSYGDPVLCSWSATQFVFVLLRLERQLADEDPSGTLVNMVHELGTIASDSTSLLERVIEDFETSEIEREELEAEVEALKASTQQQISKLTESVQYWKTKFDQVRRFDSVVIY